MDCSTAGILVHHQLPEFAQTYVHRVDDAIQLSQSSVFPFSSCLQSFPGLGYFLMSHFFASGGQSIGVSASASVVPMNIQDWFPLGWTGLFSLQSKGLSRVFSSTTVWKRQFFSTQPSLWSNSHIHTWLLKKTIALTIRVFVGKVMSLIFNTLSKFVIGFLPRSKCLLIWLQSPSAVILRPKKSKCHCFQFFPFYLPKFQSIFLSHSIGQPVTKSSQDSRRNNWAPPLAGARQRHTRDPVEWVESILEIQTPTGSHN